MKKLGMIGGMGPESTLDYYKKIVYRYQKKNSKGDFPQIIIDSVNVFDILRLCADKKYDELTSVLLKSINNLKNGGADIAVLTANTAHIVFDRLSEKSEIPLISIVESTCEKVKKDKLTKVGLLGTSFTMENDFYKKPFIEENIEIIIPDKNTRDYVNKKISKELELGVVNEETKKCFINIIEDMVEKYSIQGVILGCTELPMIIEEDDVSVNVYDTVDIHVDKIISTII